MAQIKQHRPNYFDPLVFVNLTVDFESTEELLNIPFVLNFSTASNFSHYAISEDGTKSTLMAVYDDGYEWWVIGFIDDISKVDLPKWEPIYKEVKQGQSKNKEV